MSRAAWDFSKLKMSDPKRRDEWARLPALQKPRKGGLIFAAEPGIWGTRQSLIGIEMTMADWV